MVEEEKKEDGGVKVVLRMVMVMPRTCPFKSVVQWVSQNQFD